MGWVAREDVFDILSRANLPLLTLFGELLPGEPSGSRGSADAIVGDQPPLKWCTFYPCAGCLLPRLSRALRTDRGVFPFCRIEPSMSYEREVSAPAPCRSRRPL